MRRSRTIGSRVASVLALAALALVGAAGSRRAEAQGEIFVAKRTTDQTTDAILVFDGNANGNVAPKRKIQGLPTFLNQPRGVALSGTTHELFVLNFATPTFVRSVTVYGEAAGGDPPPSRILVPTSTELPNTPRAIAVDPVNGELMVTTASGGGAIPSSIRVWAQSPLGNDPPLRSISGNATGLGNEVWGVAVDPVSNEIFVASSNAILVYKRDLDGDIAPLRTISGAATLLDAPRGLALGPDNELVVTNTGGNVSITVYRRNAIGDEAPLRTLMGPSTMLREPASVAVSASEMFVGDRDAPGTSGLIAVFSRTAQGDTAPIRTISGDATLLPSAPALAITPPSPGSSPTTLVAAVLPSSRSVTVGTTATVFATIINAGLNPALQVGISIATALPGPPTFKYARTDCLTNAVIGADNAPVDIAVGGSACFVLSITPPAPFDPTDIQFNYAGLNTAPVQVLVGINTLLMSASLTPVPDVIVLALTIGCPGPPNEIPNCPFPPTPGVLDIPGPGAFALASSNCGIPAVITVTADTGSASLPVAITVCQTGVFPCTTPSVVLSIDHQDCVTPGAPRNLLATPTFSVFVQSTGGPVAFDPAVNRIFVRFKDGGGVTRGATSEAVRSR